ncbi:MAG: ECF-type sigma factor [Pirellulaceae bacterium]
MTASDVTQVLMQVQAGRDGASERLLTMLYDELRELAAAKLRREKPGQTLQATALVHEAYLRLTEGQNQDSWDSRHHFFASAAEAMRRILIDNARRKNALKRGGDLQQASIDLDQSPASEADVALLDLDEALEKLEDHDDQAASLVKLRYFTGLTVAQSAEILGMSQRSTERLWAYAKAWLYERLH